MKVRSLFLQHGLMKHCFHKMTRKLSAIEITQRYSEGYHTLPLYIFMYLLHYVLILVSWNMFLHLHVLLFAIKTHCLLKYTPPSAPNREFF